MKRTSFYIIAGAIALLCSCHKNESIQPEEIIEEKAGITTITAEYPGDTKVSLTDGGTTTSVAFKTGDKLQLFRVVSQITGPGYLDGVTGAAIPFTIASGMGTKTGVFNADGTGIVNPGVYVAVHPGTNNGFSLVAGNGVDGYFVFSIPDVQLASHTSAVYSNAEDYMCFMSRSPIEVVEVASPPATATPVTFILEPLTSVMRLHVEDAGGFTTGRVLKSIRVLSIGGSYFGSKVSILPRGAYNPSASSANLENTNTMCLDLSGLPLGGMSVTSNLTQAGCMALYCIESAYSSITGFSYLLEFDNGSYFVVDKPKVRQWLPGSVYEIALTVDSGLVGCIPPSAIVVTSTALSGAPGTPVKLTANITPASAFVFSPAIYWEHEVSPGVWQAIPGATGTTFNTTVMATANSFRVLAVGCGEPPVISSPITINANTGTVITSSTQFATGYTGAFWRWDQKGERIIRIPVTGLANIGPWSAAVVWMDSQWAPTSGDNVLLDINQLDKVSLIARGITWNAGTEDPNTPLNEPENFTVMSGTPIVAGVAAEGDTIQFRIGLQQNFGAYNSATNPARYAMLVISYGTPAKGHKIFIRQGEGDDYVMRPTDGTRGLDAMKFSPFNITKAAPMNAPVSPMGALSHANPPAVFTDYPSQAGALFQWENSGVGSTDRVLYAWDAFTPGIPSSVSGWSNVYLANLWTGDTPPFGSLHESCPAGYRRPNDGNTIAAITGPPVAGSEIRQSLYTNPATTTTSVVTNSVWGYYADGFFDRREIVNALATSAPGANSAVSVGKANIAYMGRLFFNPTTQASLFLPAAGYRYYTTGTLYSPGANGRYHTSTSYSTAYPWYLSFTSTASNQAYATNYRSYAYSVRCVKDVCKSISSITVTRSGSGDVAIGSTVTLTGMPNVTNSFITAIQWQMEVSPGSWQDIPGATSNVNTIIVLSSGSNNYRVSMTDCGGTTTSPNISITGIAMTSPPTTGVQLANSYAGAFWRSNQKGERIIRIPITTAADAGSWVAIAAWHDNQWAPSSNDGVILDQNNLGSASLLSRGITWNSGTEDPDSYVTENYLVSGSSPFVNGVVAIGDTIKFRIGLQQTFGAYDANSNPARYAVVLLNYGTPLKTHRIYIRQGEGDDYVMRPTDGTRGPDAMKFSPFNITKAAPLNAPVSPMGISGHTDPPSIFVDFPSQAGALFQWENSGVGAANRALYAWNAYTPGTPSPAWSDAYLLTNLWTGDTPPLGSLHESCPAGYRRPNDGNTIAPITSPPVAGSEIRQSLYSAPPSTTGSSVVNSVWGYYADGFFDRRAIEDAQATSAPGAKSTVSLYSDNIAYMGRLYFNPTSQASLFLPAAGFRYFSNGALYQPGATGRYLTSTSYSASANAYPWYHNFTSTGSNQAYATNYRSYANSVRCVKDVCKPMTSITITSSVSGDLVFGSAVTLTGTPDVTTSFITAIQWQIEVSPGVWQDIPGATSNINNVIILLTGNNNYRVRMTDCGGITTESISIIGIPMATPPTTGAQLTTGYAGAFWRWNEKGERIIRIPITTAANVGPWTAVAVWYDNKWAPASNDGIVFDANNLGASSLAARGITWNAATEDPDNYVTENYTVSGSSFYVSGIAAMNDTIKFRIGLQQTFGAYNASTNPARYALVLLNYGTPAKVHRIYIRQGEGDDYLMRTTDGFNSAGLNIPDGPGARIAAAKLSPLNLTKSPPMNSPVSINGATGGSEPPAIFTQYPSQAGAFFQWANIGTRIRYAWDANTASAPSPGWNFNTGNYSPDYWTSTTPPLSDTQEVCPIGYHRPNDGATHIDVPNSTGADVLNSEMRMSLFSSPQLATTSSVVNSVWGWYADGYFDRRAIVSSATVSSTSNNIAVAGRVFFNPSPTSQASIFFPAAGYRTYNTGALTSSGVQGRYFTSSCFDATPSSQPWSFYMLSSGASMQYSGTAYRKDAGYSIRCVKD